MGDAELPQLLRAWRDRMPPATAGLPAGGARRAPGLRREELAALAGVSVDYLTRLEQGRARHPSPPVLAALARALRLTPDERDHLFRVAGQAPPDSGSMSSHLTPGLQRLLDRLTDIPVSILDAGWTLVAWNQLWAALMGDPSASTGRDRNLIWRHFNGRASRVVRDDAEDDGFEAAAVADLRAAAGRYPRDAELASLIRDLQASSPRFGKIWETGEVATHQSARKTIEHPEIGRLTLDCDVLTVQGSDLRVVAYTAAPGSADADALALLQVVGLQSVSD